MMDAFFKIVFAIFGIGLTLSFVGIATILIVKELKRLSYLTKSNLLYWKHADNTPEGMDRIDLLYIPTEKIFTKTYFKTKKWSDVKSDYEVFTRNWWQLFFGKEHPDITEIYDARIAECHEEYKKIDIIPEHCPGYRYKEVWWQWWDLPVKWLYEKKCVNGDNGDITYKVVPFNPDDHIKPEEITSSILGENINWQCSKEALRTSSRLLEKLAMAAPVLIGIASIGGIFLLTFFLMGGD
ncbi:hypothetical protein LCGC14_0967170 [marine sediment metagenome]|uniref:Uncharacterized protein n=1 Tax=marine sediment metagenome TaxID=412755 RepID=A0A0F9RJB5_9ZZZZ